MISSITPKSQVMRATTVWRLEFDFRETEPRLTEHGRKEYRRGEEKVTLRIEGFVRKEILFDNFSTYEQLERKCRKHI